MGGLKVESNSFMELVQAPLIIAVIAAGLAALIAIMDSIVNNYGDCVININEGSKELTVKGGSFLLRLLAQQKIFVPSACGGRGSCGACKAKIISDVGVHLPTEIPYLTKEEIDENVHLCCQLKVKKDLEIEIPEELFNVKEYKTKVKRLVSVTHDIKELYLELGDEIKFSPGMYMQITSKPYAKVKAATQRAYSISSPPSDNRHVELLVRLVPDGIVTTYVHQHLKEGDEMEAVGPFGDFYCRDTGAIMICVAGGSGMAPFRSILRHMEATGEINEREIWYFFGAVSKRDGYYLDDFKEMEKKYPNFHFIFALSGPKPEDNWTGETGLITDVLDRFLKEKIDSSQPREGYLCGSPGMIDACNRVLNDNGISWEKIYYDKFA
ncbi:hypothetical protein ACF0H5_024579 [Mactra antiquata]